jgi:signal transduction histidine kinase
VTSLTREAKRFFQEESKWHDHQMVHKYFELSSVAKALFRIFSFVNNKYVQTTSIISDCSACIAKLLVDHSTTVTTQGEPATTIELTEESLRNFTKEELIEYLLLSHQENKRLNNLIRTRVNAMYEIISSMTWKEDFKSQQMESLSEEDPFQEIFLSINILQNDVGDMIDKLRFLNANLENEVLARTQELSQSKLYLEEQNIKLKKINYELDTFIYRASHDLRAPLSSIQGLVSLAGKEKNSEMTDSYLGHVHKTTTKMDQLLREITDLTKNIKLEIQADKVDFKKIVEDSIQQLGSFDPLHQVSIETDIQADQLINTDAFRMKMIFSNLIGNSIKYRRINADTKIKIHMKTDHGLARIVVEDNGQGIHEMHVPYIFDMFYRANDQTYGTGLGLYMVKEAVTKMNGEIRIESQYGKGTKVFIEIPSIVL